MVGTWKRVGLKSMKYTPKPKHTDVLKEGNLQPGYQVSTDHFEYRVKGRLSYTKDNEDSHIILNWGTMFVDHALGYVLVFNQVYLGAADTICSKESYKYQAVKVGITLKQYHGDNGVCTSKLFTENLDKHH